MSLTEIKERVQKLGCAWEEFKQTHEQSIAKKNGVADPLTMEKLSRINSVLDEHGEMLNNLSIDAQRPGLIENKFNNPEDKEFANYLRQGDAMQTKAIPVPYNSTGGEYGSALISRKVSKMIVDKISANNPFRRLSTIENISTSNLEIIANTGTFSFPSTGWALERNMPGGMLTTDAAKVITINIPTYEMYVQPTATTRFLEDTNINVEEWLARQASNTFATQEEKAFVNGLGTDRPLGILSNTISTNATDVANGAIQAITSGISGDISADSLFNLYYTLSDRFIGNSVWMMHRSALARIRLLKYNGEYIWQPGYAVNGRETLIGVPVVCSTQMPTLAADQYCVMLGDFKHGTVIVDRTWMDIMRDPFTYKPLVAYYIRRRVGFSVINSEAIKLLKLSV